MRHDAFATYSLRTSAPTLTLEAQSNFAPDFLRLGQVTAYVDGQHWRTFQITPASGLLSLPLDSLSKAPHLVELIEGSQIRAYEVGDIGCTSLLQVGVTTGYGMDSVMHPYNAGLVIWGDSRTVGGGCQVPGITAWPVRLRQHLPKTEIFTPGYGSLELGYHINTPAKRADWIRIVAERLERYQTQTVYIEAGLNDYLTAHYTPAQLTSYYQALLPALHALLPKARIMLQTDVVARNEQANSAGYTLEQYRQGETDGAKGLNYVQVVDGRQLGLASDLSPDGLHLSEEGEGQFASRALHLF